jgi:hypothetical protein
LGEFAQHRAIGRQVWCARIHARGFRRIGYPDDRFMLPGICAHYLAMLCAVECCIA